MILEPVVERLPSEQWIARARALSTQRGAALIFDEMKTGFRLAPGGYQEVSGVTPDLATFGKALANGFPLAVVCGRKELMDAANRTWISSTLAGEAGALAAALAVLEWHAQADVCDALATNGAEMRRVVAAAMTASGIEGVTLEGLDPMWFLRFDDPAVESDFLQRAVAHGVLFKRGAYNYACVAHDDEAVRDIEARGERAPSSSCARACDRSRRTRAPLAGTAAADRRARALLACRARPVRLAGRERRPPARGRAHRHHVPRRVGAR